MYRGERKGIETDHNMTHSQPWLWCTMSHNVIKPAALFAFGRVAYLHRKLGDFNKKATLGEARQKQLVQTPKGQLLHDGTCQSCYLFFIFLTM